MQSKRHRIIQYKLHVNQFIFALNSATEKYIPDGHTTCASECHFCFNICFNFKVDGNHEISQDIISK